MRYALPVRSPTRPALIILLVVLLTTWGTCPCTMAKALGIDGGADASADAPSSAEVVELAVAPCCGNCCKQDDGSDLPSEDMPDAPCPCCANGGCLRDLPPQAQALDLDMPDVAVFDLPLDVVVAMLVLPTPEVAPLDSGPATDWRPHAAPVGIVRILS